MTMAEPIGAHLAHSFWARKAEWLTSLAILGIGVFILAERDPWIMVVSGVVKEYTGNSTVGALFLVWLGVVSLMALIINGWRERVTPMARAILSALRCFIWLYCAWVAIGQFDMELHTPVAATPFYPLFFIFDACNISQAAFDHEKAKAKAGAATSGYAGT